MKVSNSTPKLRDLLETGTRYEHYCELRDHWATGVAAIKRMDPKMLSSGDYILLDSLEGAVTLIEKQLDLHSQFDTKKFELKRQIDAIPRIEENR